MIGCDITSLDKPYRPKIAILEDDSKLSESGLLDKSIVEFLYIDIIPFELSSDSWFVVNDDGSTETYIKSNAAEFLSNLAEKLVKETISKVKEDPLKRLSVLRAASQLLGLSIVDLMASVQAHREPGETIVEAFEKIRNKKT